MMYKQNLIIGLSLLVLGNTIIIAQQDLQNLAEALKIVEDARKREQQQHKNCYSADDVGKAAVCGVFIGLLLAVPFVAIVNLFNDCRAPDMTPAELSSGLQFALNRKDSRAFSAAAALFTHCIKHGMMNFMSAAGGAGNSSNHVSCNGANRIEILVDPSIMGPLPPAYPA